MPTKKDELLKKAEAFVREIASSSKTKLDEKTIRSVAAKIARNIKPSISKAA